jgi:hypothetical protein
MKRKLTTLVLGTVVAGSLMLSTASAFTRDGDRRYDTDTGFRGRTPAQAPVYWGGRNPNRRWDYPAAPVLVPAYPPARRPIYRYPDYGYPAAGSVYNQDLYRRLENARRKKAYDAAHHASREQLAEDNARIARLERRLGLR